MKLIITSIFSTIFVLIDPGNPDDIPLWLWRAFVSICILIIAWFLKNMLAEAKKGISERERKIEDLVKLTAAHEVMYQIWLDEITGGNPHPEAGQRKTDKVHRLIQQIAEAGKTNA